MQQVKLALWQAVLDAKFRGKLPLNHTLAAVPLSE